MVGLKSIAAYRGGLHVQPRTFDEAAAAFPALKELARRYGRVRLSERTVLDYLLRDMADPAGGFHSAEDADSEGHEGKFYVWTPEEIRAVLGADAERALAYWGVDRGPNFEGKNILYVAGEPDRAAIDPLRRQLLAARAARVRPGRDDKVLAGWNGLACRALAEAGRALGRRDYVDAAVRTLAGSARSMGVTVEGL